MSFLGFETLGVLGKYQEGAAFAALDRLNDRPSLDEKCAWCVGTGYRKYICAPQTVPKLGAGKAVEVRDPAGCETSGKHTHSEICTHCEGTGLHGDLGVAG